MGLAVLASDDIAHGPVEVLMTLDEEAGMGGALGLEPGCCKGSMMINIDTEEWGEFYMGCAGGVDVNTRSYASPAAGGLSGGIAVHPWAEGRAFRADIHLGRGNANKCWCACCASWKPKPKLRLVSLVAVPPQRIVA
jgi:dipeptidase D